MWVGLERGKVTFYCLNIDSEGSCQWALSIENSVVEQPKGVDIEKEKMSHDESVIKKCDWDKKLDLAIWSTVDGLIKVWVLDV